MLLDISRLRRGAEEVNRQIDPEVFAVQTSDRHDEYTVKGVTTVKGTVRRDQGTTVVLDATVTSTLEMPCSRCLEPFTVPVNAHVETRFVIRKPPTTWRRRQASIARPSRGARTAWCVRRAVR